MGPDSLVVPSDPFSTCDPTALRGRGRLSFERGHPFKDKTLSLQNCESIGLQIQYLGNLYADINTHLSRLFERLFGKNSTKIARVYASGMG